MVFGDVELESRGIEEKAEGKIQKAVGEELIPLSQARLYLVGIRSGRDDFSSRLARRLTRLAAFPSPSFFDAALA